MGPKAGKVVGLLLTLCAILGMSQPASAYGGPYWLFGDKKIQIAELGIYHSKQNPDVATCAAYLGSSEDFSAGTQAMVDLADRAFEEFIGPICSANRATKVSLFVGDMIVVMPGSSAIGAPNLQYDRAVMARVLDNGGDRPGSVRVDYTLSGPHFYERVSQPDMPVKPSLREPNTTPTPTEIAPGVTVGIENIFEVNPEGEKRPFAVVLFQTDVPQKDEAANKALAHQVVQKILGDRLKSGALRGVSTGAFHEPRRGRFDFRETYRYNGDAPR